MKKTIYILTALAFLALPMASKAQGWQQISCGGEFTIGIKNDGSLWAWGFNGNGQLALPENTIVAGLPVRIDGAHDWAQVSAGGFHCMALKKNGTLWAWGSGGNGQIGIGNTNHVNDTIKQVGKDSDWASISAGNTSSYAIKKSGVLYSWGDNTYAQLGDSTATNALIPEAVHVNKTFKQVAAGGVSATALATDGTIWTWGYGGDGQLGNNDSDEVIVPTQISKDTDWVFIAAGLEFTIAKKRNGSLWSWGVNISGQCGQNDTLTPIPVPKQIGAATDWKTVACGSIFAFGIKNDNSLYGWGDNLSGELGNNHVGEVLVPVRLDSANNWKSISGATGALIGGTLYGYHTIGLKTGEPGYCATGVDYASQLGDDTLNEVDLFNCNLGIITGIAHSGTEDVTFKVFPNPTAGTLTLQTGGSNQSTMRLYVRSITGQIMFAKTISDDISSEINLGGYPNGIYILELVSENGTHVQKVVLDR